jgi:ATP-binding cassette subfamily C protein CydD
LFILLLAPAMFEPLRDLSAVWHDRASGEAALKALDELSIGGTALPGSIQADRPVQAPVSCTPPTVLIDGLRFCHAGSDRPAIENFHLSVAGGEHVALLGPSGCGKSTILALIAGLAPIEHGQIIVGETPLDETTASALRARIAWIGQNSRVFGASLFSNIGLGRPEIGRREMEGALQIASLQEIVNTRGHVAIGENGAGLSGGELVRLMLARAAASQCADLVLADEPTAHLDRQTAEDITESLLILASGRTMVVATHDPVLASRLDRIIDLRTAPLPAAELST